MDDRNSLVQATPVTPVQSTHPLAVLGIIIGGVLALVFLVTGLVAAHAQFMAGATFIAYIMIGLAIIGIPGSVIVAAVMIYQSHRREARIKEMEIERAQAQIKREDELNRARVEHIAVQNEVLRRTVNFDSVGNAAIIDSYSGQLMQLRGNYQEHPNLHTYHNAPRVTGVTEEKQNLLPAAPSLKPTIDEIVNHVKRNAYEIVLGRSLTTQEFIMIELLDAHIKLIGGSRFGKSCEAGAIIDQSCKSHDTRHLLIALLDLEYKTSRLFENDPHVLVLSTGYKKVKMHAKTPAEVAEYLILLHELMTHRYTMTDAQLALEPHILIYLEEFLYWKKLLAQFVTPGVRDAALAAFMGIATRGLKVGLHLMACAQVDYADDDLKDAMAQFLAVNVAFCVKPSAAQAAGFVASDLLKKNFADKVRGQFVVEAVGGSDIGVAPEYDVKSLLANMTTTVDAESQPQASYKTLVSELPEKALAQASEMQSNYSRNTARNETDPALQARVAQVMANPGENMADCIKRVWGATPGDNAKYKQAKAEYIQVQEIIHAMARRGMDSYKQTEMEG